MDPIQPWAMPAAQFNNWRAANDIPRLFKYLAGVLPLFEEWVASTGLSEERLHRFVPLGDLFKGDVTKGYFLNPDPQEFGNVYLCVEDAQAAVERYGQVGKKVEVQGQLEPYFHWLRQRSSTQGYFPVDNRNGMYANSFFYGGWSGADLRRSRANLFQAYPVLKLGGINLPAHSSLDARNLDFCDLDGLEIGEGWIGSRRKPINFSSCRNLLIRDTEAHFFDFHECVVTDFVAVDSNMQGWTFTLCDALGMRFDNCSISRMTFDRTPATPIFERCQPKEIEFRPDSTRRQFLADENAYRTIRAVFQGVGKTSEAGRFFYLEKCAHRKALATPQVHFREQFPGLKVPVDLLFPNRLLSGGAPVPQSLMTRWKVMLKLQVDTWLTPKYAITALRFRARWVASFLDWLIWGYGERPARIFGAAFTLVLLYTAIFYAISDQINFGEGGLKGIADCLYFSIVTFSTLGYGDILPKTSMARLLCGSEALMGAFTMGLVVAGFSNRNRY